MALMKSLLALSFSWLCTAVPFPDAEGISAAAAAVTPQIIYQFNSSFVPENIYFRKNGQLLVSINSHPYLYQLDPTQGPSQTPRLVHTFTGYQSVFGIVELSIDYFAVAVGNFSTTSGGVPGSWGISTVNLGQYTAPSYDPSKVVVNNAVSIPAASSLDGLVVINATSQIVAAGDFILGKVYNINIPKKSAKTLSSPLFQGQTSGSVFGQAGINGLKITGNKVYFTNTGKDILGYYPVDLSTGDATAAATSVFNYTIHLDDFNIAKSGNVYLTTLDTTAPAGILRRAANTPNGQNGTSLVISQYGTNSVIPVDSGSSCIVYFTAGLVSTVFKATLTGAC